jgi:diguanylate cyclase (GGDEF)-like protein
MFEADNFKQILEKHSSRMGDAILYEIGKTLKDSVRATDIPCRSGPEEFAVILAHTNSEQAMIFAERLRERIAGNPIIRGKEEAKVSISLGLVEFSPECSSPEQLIAQTGKALARSRQNGGNQTTTLSFKDGGAK